MNRIWKFIKGGSEKIILDTQENSWASIDEMPLYNWMKCSDGQLEYVNKDNKQDANNEKNWQRLHDEYLNRFGLEIEIASEKINQMSNNFGGGITIEASLIHLGKWLGYGLKIKETTVVEYYEIMKEYGKWSNKTE